MTDTPDLRTLAAEAIWRSDKGAGIWADTANEPTRWDWRHADAVLAAVLPAHRRQVLTEAADAITTLLDRYHQDLTLDTPADTAAYRAGRQAVNDAAAVVRRLASADATPGEDRPRRSTRAVTRGSFEPTGPGPVLEEDPNAGIRRGGRPTP